MRLTPLSPGPREPTAPGATRWNPARALARGRAALAEAGARQLIAGAAGELGYRRLLLHQLSPTDLPPDAGSTAFEPGEITDHREYARLRADLGRDAFEARIAAGARALCVRVGGTPTAVSWARPNGAALPYLGASITAPGSFVLFDSYTDPRHRGAGASPAIVTGWAGRLAADGARRLLVAILPENRASRRARAKLGFSAFALAFRAGWGPRAVLGVRPLLPHEGAPPR